MNNDYTASTGHLVTALCNNLKTWFQLLSLSKPMPAGHPSRNFVIPVFISVVIHAFLAIQLWSIVTDHKASTIDTPLILSLSKFTADSNEGMDLEVVPAEQHSESPVERMTEAETVVISKDPVAPGSEVSVDKSAATDTAPSFDLEAANVMTWDFGLTPEIEAETFMQHGSDAREGKSLATDEIASIDLNEIYRNAREGRWISESEIQNKRIEWRVAYMKKHKDLLPPDCRTAYAGMGLLSIPFLLRDIVTDSGCEWRQGDKEGSIEDMGDKPSIWPTID